MQNSLLLATNMIFEEKHKALLDWPAQG